jgi:hypothetical protein
VDNDKGFLIFPADTPYEAAGWILDRDPVLNLAGILVLSIRNLKREGKGVIKIAAMEVKVKVGPSLRCGGPRAGKP